MTGSPGILDRAADLRVEPDILDRLRADSSTRVIVVRERRLRVHGGRLLRVEPVEVGDAEWSLLGRDEDGTPLLVASVPPVIDSMDSAPDETWLGLRDVGGRLDDFETELFVTAVAIGAWLSEVRFCSACGGALKSQSAGWTKRCGRCRAEHFPRTDPAVIVAVESPDGERLLLGANANWRGAMHSCFAGFVEAGESMESTVHREVEEEAGVRLSGLRYVSSQAWPYPRSLMVGFRAVAIDESAAVPDGDEIIDVRWLTRDEIGRALDGDGPVGLPGESSIARRLITEWYRERA